MPNKELKYCEYFNVNEKYFPCIDESAINSGVSWQATYPHEAFISLLNGAEKMLGGITNKSLWIHGAYGTGKSQCAYALKKILEAPEAEVRAYWDQYEALSKNKVLLEKLIGHKEQGIVTAYRYASGSISTPQQLFMAVQESIAKAIAERGLDKGDGTLKESVIAWMEDPINNNMINSLLQQPEWESLFSQSTADEIINSLRKSSDVSSLMDNIFKLAAKRGITALTLTADSLRDWIIDVIEKNNVKIVLIWDEFSDFFRQNKNSLGEFQKIVSICEEKPFYFVVVTHPITSLSSQDDSWKIVQQRFDKVEITLPDNIAFNLIGHAFSVKEAAKDTWYSLAGDLNNDVVDARAAVMKAAGIKEDKVMRDILPLHPMAALVLKNIASAFQSNQRSMFDFIKTPKDMEVKAFQWFIQNTCPDDDRSFLTIDMLWDFFYEKGKDYLSSDIKLILDTYPQQTHLTENEKIVLKTILIMQAIDQRLGGTLAVLKPTEQNLSYAFLGDYPELACSCRNIANALVNKGVLILTPIAEGKKVYGAAVLAGDSAKIDKYKQEIRENTKTTAKLVQEGPQLANALTLTPALKLRFSKSDNEELLIVTLNDFAKTMDQLKHKDSSWHFLAVLALAKNEDEAQIFRSRIKETIRNEEYKNITIIDALSTPLGVEAYEHYVDFSAMSLYYQHNNGQQSKENAKKAKDVLERDWRDRIREGQFTIYTYANQEGERVDGANAVHVILQTIVLNKFRYISDFTKGLTETQLKLTQAKTVSRIGMADTDVKGLISGCEKSILGKYWTKKEYWNISEYADDSIVRIKKAVDGLIEKSFKESGKIAIGEIYSFLESEFGFSPCNVSAFICGFVLKEYKSDPYRFMNSEGHSEAMTPDKLSEMIGNCIGKGTVKPSYIISLTEEEKAFYDLTVQAWGVPENQCSSPNQAGSFVLSKMRELEFPVWTLEEVDTTGVYDVVKLYMKLVQSRGDDAHDIANKIGREFIQSPNTLNKLKDLITLDNCRKGMKMFLDEFDGGKIWDVARDIGATNNVLNDIKKLFSVKYASLWENSTGEDEIKRLIVEYEVVKHTNHLLNRAAHSKDEAFKAWRETLKFIGFSCEAAKAKRPILAQFFTQLFKIANYEEMLPENMKVFLDEMIAHSVEIGDIVGNSVSIFSEIYAPYLEGLTDAEKEEVKNSITSDMFTSSATQSNATVKAAADEFRKNQIKSQLMNFWKSKTGTKNPRDWSEKHETPILICVTPADYTNAKKAFEVMNGYYQSESEIKNAFAYIQNASFFDSIADSSYRDEQFKKCILKDYAILLQDLSYVREKLKETGVDTYSWADNPQISQKVAQLASAEYNAGGSDQVLNIINAMNNTDLKDWLSEIVKKDMGLGVKIIKNKRK